MELFKQPITMDSLPFLLKPDKVQTIKYGLETDYSAYVTSKEVNVHCKSGNHNHGSSKVKLTNRIDYIWELKYYQGQLVAVHIEGKVIAYSMKGKDGGMVRIANQETDQRALIKNLKTDVRDVSFAFLRSEVILGCVDEEGNVFIYEIDDQPSSIKYKLLLHIYHTDFVVTPPSNYRIVWCPYLPSADDDPETGDETAKMFVFLNGSKAEVWDLCAITSKYNEGPIEPDESYEGYVEIDHSLHLVDVSFSSDGTAIATACLDGYVKFYQVYMVDNEKQKLLHEWVPHDGKPLSSLVFIDNILEYSSDSRFWKFAITGANHNSELKLWSCETWTCLQTIHFLVDPTSIITNLFFKMYIDHSGQFVVMSDINNKILYVLQIKRSDAEKLVAVTTISQFLLPSPFLSFYITKAEKTKHVKYVSNSTDDDPYDEYDDIDDDDDEDDVETHLDAVVIDMLIVQPKKFQECKVRFVPEPMPPIVVALKPEDAATLLVDKLANDSENVPKLNDLQSSVTLLIQQNETMQQQQIKPTMNLMTPEDFTMTSNVVNNSKPGSVRNSIELKCPSEKHVLNNASSVEDLMDFQRPQKGTCGSGGSSPSREVQEILSLNNSTYSNQEFYDTITKIQEDEEEPSKNYSQNDSLLVDTGAKETTIWPKIPVVKDTDILKKDDKSRNVDDADFFKTNLQALSFRLTSLEMAIRDQSLTVEKTREDFVQLSKTKPDLNNELRDEISREFNLALSQHHLQIAKLLDNVLNIQKSQERDLHDSLVTSMQQLINKSLGEKIQSVVTHEMKHAILPSVVNMMESLKHQIDVQYSQKLSAADHVLRENVTKLINSKSLTEALSKSIVGTVAPSLEKCYSDMITTSLIPSWERVCSNMFQQISETFTQGTKEYTTSVEDYIDRQRRAAEKSKDLIAQMNLASETMKMSTEKLSSLLTAEIQRQFNTVFKNVQDKITANVRDTISEEVKIAFKNHASVIEDSVINAVRSRSVTPASHLVESQQAKLNKIQQCLSNGNFDEALQLALSAENLQYVVHVCEKVEVNAVFGGNCLLPQSCILSLIQQLSMDLHQNTEVKLSYIHGAILTLNRHDPDTKRFVQKVFKDLMIQLTNFVSSNPPFKHQSNARILIMALDGISYAMSKMNQI